MNAGTCPSERRGERRRPPENETVGWHGLILFGLAFVNLALTIAGASAIRELFDTLPIESVKVVAIVAGAGIIGLLVQAKPTGLADWRRIGLFVLAIDAAALAAMLALAAAFAAAGVDDRTTVVAFIAFGAGAMLVYAVSDFLMKRGFLPGCDSWRALRAAARRRDAGLWRLFRRIHFAAAAGAALAAGLAAVPLLGLLDRANALPFFANPWPFAAVMAALAALSVFLGRPPDGASWIQAALAAILAALVCPVTLVALNLAGAAVWGPPPPEVTIGVLLRILAMVLAAAAFSFRIVAAAASLGGAPAAEDESPLAWASARNGRFGSVAIAAILFLTVWAGTFLAWHHVIAQGQPTFLMLIDPGLAALLAALTAAAIPVLRQPKAPQDFYVTVGLVAANLVVMAGALLLNAWIWPFLFAPDAGVREILWFIHFGAVLPVLPLLAATRWLTGSRDGG